MNNTLNSPVGLDGLIQSVQEDLYSGITKLWLGDIDGYGRVEKNPLNSGKELPEYYEKSKIVLPEWYNSAKKDYEDVYYNDNKSAVFCFLTSDNDTTQDERVFTCKGKIVFMVDLTKILPTMTDRVVSKPQNDVLNFLRLNAYERFQVTGIERRLDTIFREYNTSKIGFDDMHPLHCFAVLVDLFYDTNESC